MWTPGSGLFGAATRWLTLTLRVRQKPCKGRKEDGVSTRIFEEVRAEYDADACGDTSKSWPELFDALAECIADAKTTLNEGDDCNEDLMREHLLAMATVPMRLLAKLDAEGLP